MQRTNFPQEQLTLGQRRTSFVRRVALAFGLAFGGVSLASQTAFAQVEGRCPEGWNPQTPRSGPQQRVIAACEREGMRINALELEADVPPNSPREAQVGAQLHAGQQAGGPVTFADETFVGVPARVSRFVDEQQALGGQTLRLQVFAGLIGLKGRGTVVLHGIAADTRKDDLENAMKSMVSNMVGLDGSEANYHVSVTCPAGSVDRAQGNTASIAGARAVGLCVGQDAQVFVIESRLPVTNGTQAAEAARLVQQVLAQQIPPGNVRYAMDEPVAQMLGNVFGYMTALHVDLTAALPPGVSPDQARLDVPIVVLPMTSGHAMYFAIAQKYNPTEAVSAANAFLSEAIRVDGAPVKSTVAGDGGVIVTAVAPVQNNTNRPTNPDPLSNGPTPSTPVENPNAELYVPEDKPQPKAAKKKRGCGCDVPGVPSSSHALALASVCALALASRRARVR